MNRGQILTRISVRHHWWIIAIASIVAGLGVLSFSTMKIDAYPDISGVQVTIVAQYKGRAAEEVEQQVTIPLERALAGVARVENIRSRTIFGIANIQLVFEPEVDDYWARQQVFQKIAEADLPDDVHPELASLSNNYGEIYRYELVGTPETTPIDLRTLQDWVIIPRLLRVSGIVEIGNFGGLAKQYAVRVDRNELLKYHVSLQEVVDALKSNNSSGGGSILKRGGTSMVVRGLGRVNDATELEDILIKNSNGSPIFLKDVAKVEVDHMSKTGEFGMNDHSNGVEGIVRMRRGEDPAQVLPNLEAAVADLNKNVLPKGVRIEPFFTRSTLINTTLSAVSHNVFVGIALVIMTLFFFLRSGPISAIVAATIPLSFLFALILMKLTGIPISLLSVGAIDFGIIVDGAVIVAENIARVLAERRHQKGHNLSSEETKSLIVTSTASVLSPMLFSMAIVIMAYLPLLSLRYIEGQLFRPMAITLCFAFIGALLGAVFLVPALFSACVHPDKIVHENPLLDKLVALYQKALLRTLEYRRSIVVGISGLLAFILIGLIPRLGTEFLPYLDEGSFWVRANFPEGISLEENARYSEMLRKIISSFDEVKFVLSQSGRVDSGTDPYPLNRSELMIGLKDPSTWKNFHSKRELEKALQARLTEEFPTVRFNLTQPIMDGVTEDTNGTSADLAVEISGPDPGVLRNLADQVVNILNEIPGHLNVFREQEGPQPQMRIAIERNRLAQYQLPVDSVMSVINTAIGGQSVTEILELDRRFDVVVKYLSSQIESPLKLGQLPVFNPTAEPIPLAQVADLRLVDGETMIARSNGQRRVTVRTDIRDTGHGEFVSAAQRKMKEALSIPEGYTVAWRGMFENLERAQGHFGLLIPLTIALIFGILMIAFNSFKTALIVMLNVPFALIGSGLALWIRGMHLSVSVGVGFTSLFGVAVMQGVLMVSTINSLRQNNVSLMHAIRDGATQRLRPILMTSITAIIGLLPASLAQGVGTDVQRPIATVVVWGVFSSALMTLFALPAIYAWIETQPWRRKTHHTT